MVFTFKSRLTISTLKLLQLKMLWFLFLEIIFSRKDQDKFVTEPINNSYSKGGTIKRVSHGLSKQKDFNKFITSLIS